jgi:hypothetical protein
MSNKRLSMRELLRVKYKLNRSNREIGLSWGIGSSTVSDYIQRVRNGDFTWPLPEGLSDTRMATSTVGTATIIETWPPDWMWSCAISTRQARKCLSTMQGKRLM